MFSSRKSAAPSGGYNLTKSLRFRSSASAYLNRTPASATNRTTWTWSAWVKRGDVASNDNRLFGAGTSNSDRVLIAIENYISVVGTNSGSNVLVLQTTPVYRDPSAWYHIVVAIDTTQATASNRAKIYVNGVQVTAFGTATYPAQNTTLQVNSANSHVIGTRGTYSVSDNFDGYLAEVNLIDGQALTPSSFGETSATTGVWIPKKYTGTYGTNGFYLPFTDTTSTSTLGTDFSGNSNTWTVNNISLTAGSTYDSMTDVPTLTSATTANYCVLNPLDKGSSANPSIQAGNLNIVGSDSSSDGVRSTIAITSGKWYWEAKIVAISAQTRTGGGIYKATDNLAGDYGNGTLVVFDYLGTIYISDETGGSSSVYYSTGGSISAGDVFGFAFDADTGKVYISQNGTYFNSGVPASGTGNVATLTTGISYFAGGWAFNSSDTTSFTFGQQPFAYTPPTGFVRLNTFNLPTPTIGATASTTANKYMDATLYTGTGSSNTIVNAGSFPPALVWLKRRSAAESHGWWDTVRGGSLRLESNTTGAESSTTDRFSGITSTGFTVTSTDPQTNASGSTYVGWQWRGSDSSAVTNTAGSITSTVSANTTAGFSVVIYTGTGANATVGHGLGVAPSMYIVKQRSGGAQDWGVYHISIGATNSLTLNSTAVSTSRPTNWNSTAPTSTVFSLGTRFETNESGATFVAYCFAPVAGYSAFGSYTGNGSSDGPFVYLGFRPRWIMIKKTSAAESWVIDDSSRSPYNVTTEYLLADSSDAAGNVTLYDFLSNGFKPRGTSQNGSGATFIYMAFAENPFKYANAR